MLGARLGKKGKGKGRLSLSAAMVRPDRRAGVRANGEPHLPLPLVFARKKEEGDADWRAPARFFAEGAATTSLRPSPAVKAPPPPFGGEKEKGGRKNGC